MSMTTICGADCSQCDFQGKCRGCVQTDGRPFGGDCVAAECYRKGGEACFRRFKEQTIAEFNALGIPDMPVIPELCLLNGAFVNLEYELPGGQKVKLLDDTRVYLGWQVERPGNERCYGLAADEKLLLVCEYGCGGSEPEIVVYKRRQNG